MAEVKNILFLCIGNTCRSQMAEGFARNIVKQKSLDIGIESGGTSAMGVVNGDSIRAMKEVGIDISTQTSDQVTDEMIEKAQAIITLGCCSVDELCPVGIYGDKVVREDWPIKDPLGKPWDFMEMVRDDIGYRVEELFERICS